MSSAISTAAIQSSLADVSTRLPLDSPLLPLCLSLAQDCDLTADALANKWDAFKYSQNLKTLESSSFALFKQRVTEEHAVNVKRKVKREESERKGELPGTGKSGYVVNGASKRIYSKETLLGELLAEDDMLSGLIPRVKHEEPRDSEEEDIEAAAEQENQDPWRKAERSEKDEKKESDVFATPSVPRHRSAYPSAVTPASLSSAPPGSSTTPIIPLTPSTPAQPLFTPDSATPATSTSLYSSRSNPHSISLTFNSSLAPPSLPLPSEEQEGNTRPVDIEVLLSVGELSDLEEKKQFRFMFADERDVKDGLLERLDTMQGALMASRAYQRLAARMREEGQGKEDDVKMKPEEEKKEDVMVVDSSVEEDKKQPVLLKVEADWDVTDLDDIGLSSTSARSQQSLVVAGRVCVDANCDDTKLTLSSVALEGSLALSGCHRINLRLGALHSYSLFPGQIVLAKGVNAHGTAMVVEELITSAPPPRLSLSPSEVQRYNSSIHPLVIVAAAGPFTTTEDFSYSPLADLVKRVNELRADVLILQGPFIDIQHPHVVNGSASLLELWEQFWPELFKTINEHTRVIIQPSTKEALHVPIFPQPPLHFSHPKHVKLVSNPSTVRINDVVLGMTTLDVLAHFVTSQSSLSQGVTTKRLPHLGSQLVHQQSFYPLFPCPSNDECVDYTHALRWSMPVRPEVLLLPSSLGKFVSEGERADGEDDGDGGLIVNGGFLSRGRSGGTYAEITVHPKSDEEQRGTDEEGRVRTHMLQGRTRVDIVRI